MKWWIFLVSLAFATFAAWLTFHTGVAPSTLLAVLVGAISLIWLLVLLTVPWNLYFSARSVIHEAHLSRERGIEVPQARENEAREIARRMFRFAIAGHIVSAAVIAVITFFSGAQVGYYFAGFYLLATAFRPAGSYLSHLRDRVTSLMEELHYPRQDVATLRTQVTDLTEARTKLDESVRDLDEKINQLRAELAALQVATETGDHDLNRRITQMTRRFDETVDGLSDNQELITGLKAFLRLVRSNPT
ncbi:hypothetical protein Aple_059610 [Acrocarpospora pleiomorpha]|uniref:Uncharacterized protein n=1 Tax=Acrocarpospora pleiomorpha TaxID=90975 RepID=A0A5M3XPZ1_9ACTN|nr:hypothetical protein [Acrocarpospora pleiomorpha]GES23062.1 hypothetical protein Aple_059610 [Acrocarpospora pleiomorpha]